MPATNTVLYAKWAPLTATVTFDSEVGSPVNSQELTYGRRSQSLLILYERATPCWLDSLQSMETSSVYSSSPAVTGLARTVGEERLSVSYTVIHQTDDGQILSNPITETAPTGSLAASGSTQLIVRLCLRADVSSSLYGS